jgi:cell division septation protein DedD
VQERTRYRISGSLFLLAIAAIFLPMIFDEPGIAPHNIPPVPSQISISDANAVAAYADAVPETDVVARVSALQGEVDEQGFSRTTGERIGEPILLTPSSVTEVWAVQAGSFEKIDNARGLRQDLRDAGYEAFVSSAKNRSGAIMHRVAVGPLLERTDATRIGNEIETSFAVKPQLVEMIP